MGWLLPALASSCAQELRRESDESTANIASRKASIIGKGGRDFRVTLALCDVGEGSDVRRNSTWTDNGKAGASGQTIALEGKNRILFQPEGLGGGGSRSSLVKMEKRYIFDGVVPWEGNATHLMHEATSQRLVSAVNRGYNGSIIVTGQGGCNETAMVEGGYAKGSNTKSGGILLHAIDDMLVHQSRQGLAQQVAVVAKDTSIDKEFKAKRTHLAFSAVMVADDGSMTDLLAVTSSEPIKLTVDVDGETELVGLKRKQVSSVEEARHVMNRISKARDRCVTTLGGVPVQTLYFLRMEQMKKKRSTSSSSASTDSGSDLFMGDSTPVTGRLTLALLSELTEIEAADDAMHARETLASAASQASVASTKSEDVDEIDAEEQSNEPCIPTFMNVVQALSHQGAVRVPYRKSKLTQVLRGALGGNAKTNVVIAVKTAPEESTHAGLLLEFGSRAREVRNTAAVSRKFTAHKALMSKYRKQLNLEEPPSSESEDENSGGEEGRAGGVTQVRKVNYKARVEQKRTTNRRFLGPQLSDSEINGSLPGAVADAPKRQGSNTSMTVIDPFARGHAAVEFPEEEDWDIGSVPRRRTSSNNGWTTAPGHQLSGSPSLTSIGEHADDQAGAVKKSRPKNSRRRNSIPDLPDMPAMPTQVMDLQRKSSLVDISTDPDQPRSRSRNSIASAGKQEAVDLEMQAAVEAARDSSLEYEEKLKKMSEQNRLLLEQVNKTLKEKERVASPADKDPPPKARKKRTKSGRVHRPDPLSIVDTDEEECQREEEAREEEQIAQEELWSGMVESMSATLDQAQFSGANCCDWFLQNIESVATPANAAEFAQSSMDVGAISRLDGNRDFEPAEDVLYQFTWNEQLAKQEETRMALNIEEGEDGGGTFFYNEDGVTMRRTSMDDNYTGDHVLPDDPLLVAIATKEPVAIIKSLAEEFGTDAVDKLGRGVVAYCVIADYLEACKYLCKYADVNLPDFHGHTPLLWAAYRGSLKMMKVLLDAGAILEQTDTIGRTALHWATRLEGTDCVELLLKYHHGGDPRYFVNLQDRREQLSALHWAVAGGKARAARMLVRAGADPGCMDAEGRSTLSYANKYQSHNCFREIIKHRPDLIGYRDTAGRTSLHLVCGPDGVVENVAFLLSFKETSVNAPDLHLRTPLHWASTYNRVGAVRLLLHAGGRKDAIDSFSRRPIDLACAKGNVESVVALGGNEEAIMFAQKKRSEEFGETEPGAEDLKVEDIETSQDFKKFSSKIKAGKAKPSTSKACAIM
jgi:ankyrin repeat protein